MGLANKRQSGFTLIETVVYVLLFGILVLILTILFIRHSNVYGYQTALMKSSGSARSSMNNIVQYTLQAREVLASGTVGGVNYSSNSNTLVLQLPTVTPSGTVVPNTWDYVAYYLNGKQLFEKIDANASSFRKSGTKLLSESILSITFTYDSGSFPSVRKVTVDLRTQEKEHNSNVNTRLLQQIVLRNK